MRPFTRKILFWCLTKCFTKQISFANISKPLASCDCYNQCEKLIPVSDKKALRNVRGDIAVNYAHSSKLLFIE